VLLGQVSFTNMQPPDEQALANFPNVETQVLESVAFEFVSLAHYDTLFTQLAVKLHLKGA
jgi:hypothetical protein